jgi:hypothetical protein
MVDTTTRIMSSHNQNMDYNIPRRNDWVRPHPGCFLKSLSSASSYGSTKSKGVSFDCIEIREFPIELGDNPAVSSNTFLLT